MSRLVFPFLAPFRSATAKPYLPIRILNPDTGLYQSTYGLIDTGADECAIPAQMAEDLGHNLDQGHGRDVFTGNGKTVAYAHTCRIDILHQDDFSIPVMTVADTPIDCLPNLHVVLLGVGNFLSRFVLTIDYPQQRFSIDVPE